MFSPKLIPKNKNILIEFTFTNGDHEFPFTLFPFIAIIITTMVAWKFDDLNLNFLKECMKKHEIQNRLKCWNGRHNGGRLHCKDN
jgi:hypothetical protein